MTRKSSLPPTLIETISRLHDSPDRGYHDWSHPLALLSLLPEVRDKLHDPLAVDCAIVLHDAVYDPRASDKERRSAVLAAELLSGVVGEDTIARTVKLIEATERHQVPEDLKPEEAEDCRIFLDMDLSILGADEETFDRYEAGVRREYRHVPEPLFRQGRAAILERFLGRDRLFLSDWGLKRFEARARANLRRSVAALITA